MVNLQMEKEMKSPSCQLVWFWPRRTRTIFVVENVRDHMDRTKILSSGGCSTVCSWLSFTMLYSCMLTSFYISSRALFYDHSMWLMPISFENLHANTATPLPALSWKLNHKHHHLNKVIPTYHHHPTPPHIIPFCFSFLMWGVWGIIT